jgi:hypothetical protein
MNMQFEKDLLSSEELIMYNRNYGAPHDKFIARKQGGLTMNESNIFMNMARERKFYKEECEIYKQQTQKYINKIEDYTKMLDLYKTRQIKDFYKTQQNKDLINLKYQNMYLINKIQELEKKLAEKEKIILGLL